MCSGDEGGNRLMRVLVAVPWAGRRGGADAMLQMMLDRSAVRQNPYVEPFGSKVRDELLAVEPFSGLGGDEGHAQALALGLQPPAALRARDDGAGPVRKDVARERRDPLTDDPR
jgi:hypothetical protein